MKSWKGKQVLIMGLGTKNGGTTSARYAARQGADVLITDLQDEYKLQNSIQQLQDLPIKYRLGRHDKQDFLSSDIIIKNPGIKPDHPLLFLAKQQGCCIETPLTLFIKETKKPFIGITGTKGKSFTTALTVHLCNKAGTPAISAGNNCINPLTCLETPDRQPVLELSSWQLRDIGKIHISPQIACWLNFFPDHQDHYNSMKAYFTDKKQIILHQKETDIAILPANFPKLSELEVNGTKQFFSADHEIPDGWIFTKKALYRQKNNQIINSIKIDRLPEILLTPHWHAHIAAALSVAEKITGTTDLLNGLITFPGIRHRMQYLLAPQGYAIINDSASSTPESCISAIQSNTINPITLIAGGGGHKNLDYSQMAALIGTTVANLILFNNDPASEKLLSFPEIQNHPNRYIANTMQEAVQTGIQFLFQNSSGTLLLSPGCSGAPLFQDLFQRGEKFISSVQKSLDAK